ncbi:MAG: hypothetical protein Q8941_12055 [Bacteroidota bacterium]|nr:hypothetical protein [Bacteroidota bacterium]
MRKVICAVFVVVTCITVIASCSKGSMANNNSGGTTTFDCASSPKTFAADANPVIQTFCNQASCHNAGSTNGVGPLTNFDQIFNARASIRAAIASGIMPQNTTLTTAQKTSIICWIDNGAQNN